MLIVQNAILSDDIIESYFVCDLSQCKGACCVEGDFGAPLLDEERDILSQEYEKIKPFLSPEGIAAVEKLGLYEKDFEGDYNTTLKPNHECVFVVRNEKGVLACGIEQAFLANKTSFRKPISCHLYPIRITKYDEYEAINYHRWAICDPACALGKSLKVPLYVFLKDALIRKYGAKWYDELCLEAEIRLEELAKENES